MCPLRPTGQPFNISTWSPSGPPSLLARMPLLALALTLALALFAPLPTCHHAHLPPRLRPVPPRGKAAQVGSALRVVLDLPRNKKAGDPGISPRPRPLHLSTLSTCQLVNLPASAALWPTGQQFNRSTNAAPLVPVSPCPRAPSRRLSSPRYAFGAGTRYRFATCRSRVSGA
jgi:hypothetical protein